MVGCVGRSVGGCARAVVPTLLVLTLLCSTCAHAQGMRCHSPPPPPPPSRCQAELADPNAKPNKAALPAVDVCLRHVAHALLEGTAAAAPAATADVGGGGSRPALASSLAYLRDRVGVPRDMGQAAAMHLRANLNWMIGQL